MKPSWTRFRQRAKRLPLGGEAIEYARVISSPPGLDCFSEIHWPGTKPNCRASSTANSRCLVESDSGLDSTRRAENSWNLAILVGCWEGAGRRGVGEGERQAVAVAGNNRRDRTAKGTLATGQRLFHRDRLGEVPGLVDVAATAHRDVIGQQLQGHDLENGGQFLRGRGNVDDVISGIPDFGVAFGSERDDLAGARLDLLEVGHGLFVADDGQGIVGVAGGDDDDGQVLVDEGIGAVLHFAGGVALGVNVGDFLQLEGAFEGDGVVDAAAEEEKVLGAGVDLGEFLAFLVAGKDLFELSGHAGEVEDRGLQLGWGQGPPHLAQVERKQVKGGELRGEGLGRGHANFWTGMGVDGALGLARDHGSDDVADGEGLAALAFGFALGGDGVGGLARLRDEQGDGIGGNDGVAIAPLAGVIDLDGNLGQTFDHELAGLAGVPAGAAGGDVDFACGAELVFGDFHLLEEDLAGVLGDAAEGGVADGAGLLIDFLEHEVLVTALFGHDGVPGDVLHLAGDGVAVEIGDLHALGCDHGQVAVGEEEQVAGVEEDGGYVGSDEVLVLAEADDRGRAIAGGDDLVGIVDGDHAEREYTGKFLDRLADGFFEQGTVSVAGLEEVFLDEVGDDFGVGLGGGPAGVADAVSAVEGLGANDLLEVAELAFGAADLQALAIAGNRDTGGIVAAVLQAPQPVNDDRDDLLLAHVTDDATHKNDSFTQRSRAEGRGVEAGSASRPGGWAGYSSSE